MSDFIYYEDEIPECFYSDVNRLVPILDADGSNMIDHEELLLFLEVISGMGIRTNFYLKAYNTTSLVSKYKDGYLPKQGVNHSEYPVVEEILKMVAFDSNLPKNLYCEMTEKATKQIEF